MSRSRNLHRASPARGGFTLVELLVVIGIIAVLVGILLPTLGRARQSANSVKCMANLRQIGMGLQLYVGQNKGMMPIGYVQKNAPLDDGGTYTGESLDWTTLILAAMSKQKGSDYASQQAVGTGADAGTRAIFYCPEAYRDTSAPNFPTQYSAHPRLLPNVSGEDFYEVAVGGPQTPIPLLRTYKLARIKQPAEKMVIFDATLRNNSWQAYACAVGLDRYGISRRPYLTDNFSLNSTMNPNQPVDMTPLSESGPSSMENVNKDGDVNVANIRFRHIGDSRANGLMLDGHVETFTYNKNTKSSDLLRKHIYVTPPR